MICNVSTPRLQPRLSAGSITIAFSPGASGSCGGDGGDGGDGIGAVAGAVAVAVAGDVAVDVDGAVAVAGASAVARTGALVVSAATRAPPGLIVSFSFSDDSRLL